MQCKDRKDGFEFIDQPAPLLAALALVAVVGPTASAAAAAAGRLGAAPPPFHPAERHAAVLGAVEGWLWISISDIN